MIHNQFVNFESLDFRAANYQSTNRNYPERQSTKSNGADSQCSHRMRSYRQSADTHRAYAP
jgi:hypothetical protein